MRFRKLPKTDLSLSEVSFGCMSLQTNSNENRELLQSAYDQGINYFDTADLYQNGENERLVGEALGPIRNKVIIASKVGNQMRPDGSGWDWNPTKDYILSAIDQSLKRLNTDYIDIYQLHGGTIDDLTDETIEAFELLKDQGKIRHYGISSIRPNVIRRWIDKSNLVSNMMQYSLLDRRPEESSLELLGKASVGIMVRGSVARGLLSGKPLEPYLGHDVKEISRLIDVMKTISGRSLNEIAVNYVLHRPEVTTAVVGMRTEGQLMEALAAVEAPSLSKEEINLLQDAVSAKVYEAHR